MSNFADHDNATSDGDPLDLLRAADPINTASIRSTDDPTVQARFDAITASAPHASISEESAMTTTDSNPESAVTQPAAAGSNPPRFEDRAVRRDRRRRRGMTAVAAAAVSAMAFGGLTLIPGSTPEAAAAVLQAAERTEASDSGVMIVDFGIDDDGERIEQEVTVRYDGRDLAVSLAPGDGSMFGAGGELTVVDGDTFARLGDSGWFELDDSPLSAISTAGLPSDIRDSVTEQLIEIVRNADNVEEIESNRFTATTTMAEIGALTQSIPGFDPLGSGDMPDEASALPVDVDLTLDDDGFIDLVTVSIDGADISEAADDPELDDMTMTVTVDFDDLGEDQGIEAPADATPMDLGGLGDDLGES